MKLCKEKQNSILEKLKYLYPNNFNAVNDKLLNKLQPFSKNRSEQSDFWSEKDVVVITYADMIYNKNQAPLKTLNNFIEAYLPFFNIVHILPFYPFSSDGGFAVKDYQKVYKKYGSWSDIDKLSKKYHLMLDLVINHVSSKSNWFRKYLDNEKRYKDYFIEVYDEKLVQNVIRPRNYPLLSTFKTKKGYKKLWTTFSEDQIDLNFANPDVLLEMIDIMLFYIQHGARVIRIDAIAYLWKKLGTTCIHLPETHTVVKLFRDIVECCDSRIILLTETNVPHVENMSYFGNGNDESHIIYQFTLPPLVLYSIITGDAKKLTEWASKLKLPDSQCTFLNFTASHDGIGVRPLEKIFSYKEINEFCLKIMERGGYISNKRNPDGSDSPYELNVTYYSALENNDVYTLKRFLASQSIMLTMQGIPAVYFHSMFATKNAYRYLKTTHIQRDINRSRYNLDHLVSKINNKNTIASKCYYIYRKMIEQRTSMKEFHPNVKQIIFEINPGLFVFRRGNVISATNVTDKLIFADMSNIAKGKGMDVINQDIVALKKVPFHGYQFRWIKI